MKETLVLSAAGILQSCMVSRHGWSMPQLWENGRGWWRKRSGPGWQHWQSRCATKALKGKEKCGGGMKLLWQSWQCKESDR